MNKLSIVYPNGRRVGSRRVADARRDGEVVVTTRNCCIALEWKKCLGDFSQMHLNKQDLCILIWRWTSNKDFLIKVPAPKNGSGRLISSYKKIIKFNVFRLRNKPRNPFVDRDLIHHFWLRLRQKRPEQADAGSETLQSSNNFGNPVSRYYLIESWLAERLLPPCQAPPRSQSNSPTALQGKQSFLRRKATRTDRYVRPSVGYNNKKVLV